jgi:rhodanese-related sulfurtransferase
MVISTFGGPVVKFFTEYTNVVLIVVLVISGALLLWPMISRRNRGLSAQEATELINRRNAVVIDVRPAAEYTAGHLPQARHLDLADVPGTLAQVAKNKNNPVLLVCQTGQRAPKAEAGFREAGYAEVFTLQGGMAAWQQAGMPVVKPGVVK